ncbi:efflux RND transporter periplasmic adaptor subunit [Calothrix sp. CCY 0018]|uniref:efflux RND transporter periplasmic adaptor subunit n=1 Tax=Calothrix sp. CCY 0018 TaxID=3103864 RepID=UPI0039C678CE
MSVEGKKRFKVGIKWIVLSAILTVVGVGGWLFLLRDRDRSSSAVALPIVPVEKGDVEITVSEGGTLELGGQQEIKSPTKVVVEKVLVKIGDSVAAGDKLVILRNSEGQKNLADQDLQIKSKELAFARSLEKVVEARDKLATAEKESRQPIKQFEIENQQLKIVRSQEKVKELEQKLATSKQQLAQERRQKLQIENQKQQLALTRMQEKIAEAKYKLDGERNKLKNQQLLASKGFIAGDELQAQQEAVRSAESSLRDSELEVRNQMLEYQTKEIEQQREREEQRQNLLTTQSELREAVLAIKSDIGELNKMQLEQKRLTPEQEKLLSARSELREAIATVQNEKTELQRAKVERNAINEQLTNNLVTAPISGKILDVQVKDGDGMETGNVLLVLGNPGKEIVKLQLATLEAGKVKVNQPVRIKTIGPNAEEFSGRIKNIHPIATSGDGDGGGFRGASGQAKVPATIELDKPSGNLIPGSQVSVEIVVEQRKQVVAVNLEALQREGEPFVWIKDAQNKAQKRKVTLGLEGATKVEVKSGLKAGEKIILPLPDVTIEPGTLITELGDKSS